MKRLSDLSLRIFLSLLLLTHPVLAAYNEPNPTGIWVPNGNNARLPFTYVSSTSQTAQTRVAILLVRQAKATRFQFVNWTVSAQGEQRTPVTSGATSGPYDFTLRAGVRLLGKWYPITFNGQRNYDLKYGSSVISDPVNVPTPKMTIAMVDTLRTADNLNYTSYNQIVNVNTRAVFGEGGSNTATDYTLGGCPGDTLAATVNYSGVSNGSLVFGPGYPGSASTGYTTGLSLDVYDPTFQGSGGGISYAVMTGSSGSETVSSYYQPTAGSNYSNRTLVGLYGGGCSLSNTTAGYGPSGVAGLEDGDEGSLATFGNSYDAGVGADDGNGDEFKYFGITERSFARHGQILPIVDFSDIGNYEASFLQGNFDYSITQGLALYTNPPRFGLVGSFTNDIASAAYTIAQLKANESGMITKIKSLGIPYVIGTTVPPRTTSTDGWVTTTNQAPVTGFAAGGLRDQLNSGMSGYGFEAIIDMNAALADPVATDRFVVPPSYTGITKTSGDGIHINGPAIDYYGTQIAVPQLIAPNATGALVRVSAQQVVGQGAGTNVTTSDNLGSTGGQVRTVTANYTAGSLDDMILCNAAGGPITISLPQVSRRTYTVTKIDTSANACTVTPLTGTIAGAASYSLAAQNSTIEARSDGTNYWPKSIH